MGNFKILLASALLVISSAVFHAQKQYGWPEADWSRIYQGTGLLKSWPESGTAMLFKIAEGNGHIWSSPLLDKWRIFLSIWQLYGCIFNKMK
jgi:hypothetical protein